MLKGSKNAGLRGAVALSHFFLRERVQPGDRVVDATCGNGRDTLLLARLVGPTGCVWAFDVQKSAVAATSRLLDESGCLDQAEIKVCGHERLAELVKEPLAAAVFNLGYLPGGDREVITVAQNTVAALKQAADLLQPRGIITVCIYTGHPAGSDEGSAVEVWSASLDPGVFNVWRSRQMNRPDAAPYLLLVEKGER